MYLSIGELHGVHLLGGQDFFHVQMRVRRHLLDFKRKLALGRLGLARADHLSNCPFLYRDDLLHSNKQHWDGVVRMFSDKTVNWAKQQAEKDPRIKPTYSFLYFGSRLLRMVNGDCDQPASGISPTKMSVLRRQAVADAAFCMVFLLLWRYWLSKLANTEDLPDGIEKPYSVKDNFMTRETFLDIILLCQCRILLVKLYREKFPNFRIFGDRFSSRFAEYVFQYARMMETNAPLFGVLGFMRHLSHFFLQIEMAAKDNVKMPHSKRGVPNDVSRVEIEKWAAPLGWHLSDAEICAILDSEASADPNDLGLAVWWWAVYLECPEVLTGAGLSDSDNFFSDPVKHFGRGDVWGAGVDDAPANEEVREDEDNLDGPQVEDLAVEVEVLDCSDEVDAGVVFGDICRKVELIAEEVEKAANAEEAANAERAANCSKRGHPPKQCEFRGLENLRMHGIKGHGPLKKQVS